MQHIFSSLLKYSYQVCIAITLTVFVFVIASAILGALFAARTLNGALEKQVEPAVTVTYFNIEKLESIKGKLP